MGKWTVVEGRVVGRYTLGKGGMLGCEWWEKGGL